MGEAAGLGEVAGLGEAAGLGEVAGLGGSVVPELIGSTELIARGAFPRRPATDKSPPGLDS